MFIFAVNFLIGSSRLEKVNIIVRSYGNYCYMGIQSYNILRDPSTYTMLMHVFIDINKMQLLVLIKVV